MGIFTPKLGEGGAPAFLVTNTGSARRRQAELMRPLLPARNPKRNPIPGEPVPTLTGLTTPVTFLENTVNATPQIIAADVTFNDADNNFDGGALTVTGLLAQDTVAIRNQGTGAGQIGISGSSVTFGGTVIGSFSGGAGSSLAVTFNASATAQAIEALIENLTYANSSDTPTASRSLELKITDAAGAVAIQPPTFVEQTGAANPVGGIDVGYRSAPTLADLDGDGDLDMVVGDTFGNLRYYKNTGTAIARSSAFRTAPPIRSTASTSAPRARRPSPTSTATATSTPSSAQMRAP